MHTKTAYAALFGLLALFQFAVVVTVTASFAEESAADDPLPEGVLARVNGAVVSEDDYRNFLLYHVGRAKLSDFVDKILIEEEAQHLGVRVSYHRVVERAEAEFDQYLKFFQNRSEYESQLRQRGLTIEDVKADIRKRLILEETLELCILERRKRAGEESEASPSKGERQAFLEGLRKKGNVKIAGR